MYQDAFEIIILFPPSPQAMLIFAHIYTESLFNYICQHCLGGGGLGGWGRGVWGVGEGVMLKLQPKK